MILGLLGGLFKGKNLIMLIIGGVAVVGIGYLYISNQNLREENTILERNVSTLKEANESIKNQYSNIVDELEESARRSAKLEAEASNIKRKVEDAPETDNGPIAPVTNSTLEWLRNTGDREGGR